MRVACLGGGPAGLIVISMKLCDAAHEGVVIERNMPDDTVGASEGNNPKTSALFASNCKPMSAGIV